MRDFGKILTKIFVTWIFSAVEKLCVIIDFIFSKVSLIFSFHLKVVAIYPEYFPEGVNDKNRFNNVTQVSCSLTGIFSIIDFLALNDAHFQRANVNSLFNVQQIIICKVCCCYHFAGANKI